MSSKEKSVALANRLSHSKLTLTANHGKYFYLKNKICPIDYMKIEVNAFLFFSISSSHTRPIAKCLVEGGLWSLDSQMLMQKIGLQQVDLIGMTKLQ